MDISFVNDYFVPVIIAICLGVGFVLKNFLPTDNKWIPLVLAVVGVACGVAKFGITLDAVACGLVSGLASIGLHQAFKQILMNGGYKINETTEDEVRDYLLEKEEDEAEDEEVEEDEQEA